MFRLWAAVFLGAAVSMPGFAWAGDEGGQGQSGGGSQGGGAGGRLERQVQIDVKLITVKTADLRQFGIDWVGLSDGQTTLFADAGEGVSQESQDRLDLSFVPFLGGITGSRYSGADVSPQTRVGSAWILDRVLFVALDGRRTDILARPKIVVLNNEWAFVMATPALPIDWPNLPDFAAINETPPFRDFAAATVSLPEVGSVLIGGLDTAEKVEAASRVPGLGDVPLLGRLFLGSAHQRDRDELIVLVKPSIVANDE